MEVLIKSPVMLDRALELGGQAVGERVVQSPKPVQPSVQAPKSTVTKPDKAVATKVDEASQESVVQPKSATVTSTTGEREPEDLAVARTEHAAAAKEAEERALSKAIEQGLEEGRRTAAAECAVLHDMLKQVAESASESLPRLLAEAQDVIAAVVFEAVSKIVGRELVSPEGCAAAIEQVVSRISRESIVSIKVAPSDFDRLNSAVNSGISAEPVLRILDLPLEPDPQVGLGGCILTLKAGSLDGRIETQFRNFAQTLKDAASVK